MRYYVSVAGRTIEVELTGAAPRIDGREVSAELATLSGSPIRSLIIDGRSHVFVAEPGERRGAWHLAAGSRRYDLEIVDERTRTIREMAGGAEVATAKSLTAPMPGLVVRVEIEAGQVVRAGQGLLVVEAMKMENELKAPSDGVVATVAVVPGQTVEKGATLVVLE